MGQQNRHRGWTEKLSQVYAKNRDGGSSDRTTDSYIYNSCGIAGKKEKTIGKTAMMQSVASLGTRTEGKTNGGRLEKGSMGWHRAKS